MLRSLGRNVVERSIVVNHRARTYHITRPLSSSTPSTKTTPSTTLEHIPPSSPPPRKSKVELRPGPIKPADTTRPSVGHAAAISKSTKKSPVTPTVPSSSPPELSVAETTKRDIEDAVKHGLLVPPPPHYNKLRKLIHQAIQLAKFYWRGLKLINTHRIRVREIRKRVLQGGPPVSRWESRFIQTYRQDLRKLIPFVIIVLVMEEIIPLIAMYAPSMLPSTCILPSQRDRIETTRTNKQIAASELYRRLYDDIRLKEVGGYVPLATLGGNEGLSQALCMLLRLSSWGPNGLRIRRIRRHLEHIAKDDKLLIQEDMGARLTNFELVEALHDRGMVTADLGHKDQERRLKWWLDSTNKMDVGDPVTVRILAVARSGAR